MSKSLHAELLQYGNFRVTRHEFLLSVGGGEGDVKGGEEEEVGEMSNEEEGEMSKKEEEGEM